MRSFVTGAAGFIGSNLTDRLLANGHTVVGFDDFSTGRRRFLADAIQSSRFSLVEGDVLDAGCLTAAMSRCDLVFHLAANADVRFGTEHPAKDLEQNTIATFNVLEAMRANGVRRIAFSVHRFDLRRAGDSSDAGERAVPRADLALRRVEARR